MTVGTVFTNVSSIRVLCIRMLCLFCLSLAVQAEEADVPGELSIDESLLMLNGSGLRSRLFIDLYVGSLYLSHPESDASNIIQADESMAIRLSIVSSLITGEKLRDATLDGFNQAVADTSALDERISRFLRAFSEPLEVGDLFQLSWNPNSDLLVVTRNDVVVEQIEGLDFKQALFAIWLGEDPVQESLKDEMLGLAD